MVDFEQYPHTITSSQSAGTEPYQDSNGDWVIQDPGSVTVISSEGRAKPNDQGKTVSGEDGTMQSFAWLIYLPQTAPDFLPGSIVTIEGIGTGSVKRFFRGQLNCMMWA